MEDHVNESGIGEQAIDVLIVRQSVAVAHHTGCALQPLALLPAAVLAVRWTGLAAGAGCQRETRQQGAERGARGRVAHTDGAVRGAPIFERVAGWSYRADSVSQGSGCLAVR
jgi:hypothetical protein